VKSWALLSERRKEDSIMKILSGNRFALGGVNGEVITVKITAQGTAFVVAYTVVGGQVIDGPPEGEVKQGVPLKFKLDKSQGARNNLNLGFTFATPGQVAGQPDEGPVEYDVEVTSNAAGSDASREFVDGSFGIPTDNRQWRFFIS